MTGHEQMLEALCLPFVALDLPAVALVTPTLPHAVKAYFSGISKVMPHKLMTGNGSLSS